jgi:hypothetical protein
MSAGARWVMLTAAILAAGWFAACASISPTMPDSRRDLADSVISHWSDSSRLTAAKFIEEYGPPDQIRYSQITWFDRSPWKRIAVWDDSAYKNDSVTNLEETVQFPVPPVKSAALTEFSVKLRVSPDREEISARYPTEEQNFLALNLAYEIIKGFKDTSEARVFFDDTVQLSVAGRSSPYMQRLLFSQSVLPEP